MALLSAEDSYLLALVPVLLVFGRGLPDGTICWFLVLMVEECYSAMLCLATTAISTTQARLGTLFKLVLTSSEV